MIYTVRRTYIHDLYSKIDKFEQGCCYLWKAYISSVNSEFLCFNCNLFFAPLWRMGPLCSSAETQVCHRGYIIAAKNSGRRSFSMCGISYDAYYGWCKHSCLKLPNMVSTSKWRKYQSETGNDEIQNVQRESKHGFLFCGNYILKYW